MDDPWQAYRAALARRVHPVCIDRNLDPLAPEHTEGECRIERFLPELIGIVAERRETMGDYEASVGARICSQCGHEDATGRCAFRDRAECCLWRYLPLIIDAIEDVQRQRP